MPHSSWCSAVTAVARRSTAAWLGEDAHYVGALPNSLLSLSSGLVDYLTRAGGREVGNGRTSSRAFSSNLGHGGEVAAA